MRGARGRGKGGRSVISRLLFCRFVVLSSCSISKYHSVMQCDAGRPLKSLQLQIGIGITKKKRKKEKEKEEGERGKGEETRKTRKGEERKERTEGRKEGGKSRCRQSMPRHGEGAEGQWAGVG